MNYRGLVKVGRYWMLDAGGWLLAAGFWPPLMNNHHLPSRVIIPYLYPQKIHPSRQVTNIKLQLIFAGLLDPINYSHNLNAINRIQFEYRISDIEYRRCVTPEPGLGYILKNVLLSTSGWLALVCNECLIISRLKRE